MHQISSLKGAACDNDKLHFASYGRDMISDRKQLARPHFIREWAESLNLSQVKLAKAVGADKSLVSRWYSGATPLMDYQEKLAALFNCERDSLFRHPAEDWLVKFLRGRTPAEIERIKATLEAAFPR